MKTKTKDQPDDGLFVEGTVIPSTPQSAVAVQDHKAEVVLANDAATLMQVIARVASDPTVDVNKLVQLEAMYERMKGREKEAAFNDAMMHAQSEMTRIAADSNNPQTKSRYASYPALDRAVRPIYTKHGFALSFDTEEGAPEQHVRVVCFATCAGHTRKYKIDMPADGKGAKGGDVMTKTHATGAGITYAKRYLLLMIFNIAVGEDDDGNGASKQIGNPLTSEQIEQIVELAAAVSCPGTHLLTHLNKTKPKGHPEAKSLDDLPASRFDEAISALRSYEANRKARDAETKGAAQ